jgi:hypothetical protein
VLVIFGVMRATRAATPALLLRNVTVEGVLVIFGVTRARAPERYFFGT